MGLFSLENGINAESQTRIERPTPGPFPAPLIFSRKFLGTRFIFASIVDFSNNDVDGSEIVIFKINSRFFKLFCVYFKCRRISLKLISGACLRRQ